MWSRLKAAALWAWRILATPAATLSLGFLTLGGFVGGVMFWGAFNTALELTNTEQFCISCHEMETNVYQELTRTDPLLEPFGRQGIVPGLSRPARMDRQDRQENAGFQRGLGQDLRHHQHPQEVPRIQA